ncbi:LysR substrate-binding domain-containing protein [Amnimonas aquatica]|uniref:LysR family transcriptional regulator n=1 Tax=Amnimonas aquatica TaxID=2094561 RepID=A0A2P6AU88_9GAMM|nr:LysR substrate-binding domain-containing protein [Amnimonas aquatica]PQA49430.1 LysR family transcriptional regulator [Amnimonas aquatica]
MTLTELRYLVTLAQERHFGRAAERCHVAQPTLSVAIRKLEDSLGIIIFERHRHGVLVTPAGEALIAQAQVVLHEAEALERMADQSRDEFAEPLRLGAIFTVGPYLFPGLIRHLKQEDSPLRLYLEENYTHVLAERLAHGELDAILVALPFDPPETRVTPLFDEPFRLLLPQDHDWVARSEVPADALGDSPVLMLGEGHCFRDQVLETCSVGSAPSGTSPGSSLMTLRHMVASGLGITLIPASAEPILVNDEVACRPLTPSPGRRIVLASRHRFPRRQALQALTRALQTLELPGTVPMAR